MTKKLIINLVLLLASVSILAAKQNISSDNLRSFSIVEATGKMSIQLIPSEKNAIEVTLNQVDLTRFRWAITDGGVLKMSVTPKRNDFGTVEAKIYYSQKLEKVHLTTAQILSEEVVEAHMLMLILENAAIATLNICAEDFEIQARGNSIADVKGGAKYVKIAAKERSTIKVQEMHNTSIEVVTESSAEVHIAAYERMIIDARGSSSVFYKGTPMITKIISGELSENIFYVGERQ